MLERIATGWNLAKQALHVLKLDKELLLFPVLSGISCCLVLASFALPMWQLGVFDDANVAEFQESPLTWVVLFAYYFVNYFVIVFFNSALVACAVIRLKGGDPTVMDGISAAMARLPQIAAWAAVSATVGLVLKVIESRSERVGQIVAGLFGVAWSILTFFVVPVLVVEKTGPIKSIQRSVGIMKRAWGESLSANFSIGLITFLMSLLCLLPIGGGIALIANEMTGIGLVCILVGILMLFTISLISSALNSIILAALYIFACEGRSPHQFEESTIRSAFARS